MVEPRYGKEKADRILAACWKLEELKEPGDLVWQDDPEVRELFAFVLRDAGAHVIAVDSGEVGVRAAALMQYGIDIGASGAKSWREAGENRG